MAVSDLAVSDLVVTMQALVEVPFLEVACLEVVSLEALMLVTAEAMQPLQQEHLARLSLVQCMSHSTGLSPCQHLSQIRFQCLSPILSQLRSLLPSLCRRLLMCQCQFPFPHLSSGPWNEW